MLLRSAPVARIIGLLSLILALGGCSAVKLGYNNLPELAYWWIDGYVDLEDAQALRVRQELARIHTWHRLEELPRILPLLGQLERMAGGELSPAQACALEPAIRERIDALRAQLEPAVAGLAPTLTAAQLRHLERKYAQNNREFERRWVRAEPAELLERRAKLFAERAETVYGHLEERQHAVLRQELQASGYRPHVVLAERRRRQQETLQVLRTLADSQASPEQALVAVRGLMERFFASPDPAYRAHAQAQREEVCRVAAAVHNSTTPAQRDHAARRFRAWQRDLAELSQQR